MDKKVSKNLTKKQLHMNILFISDILFTGDFVRRLASEGNEIKVYIGDENNKANLENLIPKTDSWEDELGWVGKDGLIIFEDVGFGEEQERLRSEGYTVLGGSLLAEKTELDRVFGQEVLKKYGLNTLPVINFDSHEEAISYIENNQKEWVIKYSNGHMTKHLCYIGKDSTGGDVISILKNTALLDLQVGAKISLQEKVNGTEISIARYFNGNDWVGPIEYSLEHTHLFPGNIGPNVDEMGTLAWYDNDEEEPLYKKTLSLLKDFLSEANFRGDYAIDCIVNNEGIFPLEMTARLGSPIIHVQEQLNNSPFAEFLYAVAKGYDYSLDWKKGFGVVVACVTTPFPYPYSSHGDLVKGLPVYISSTATKEDLEGIHFDEIASRDGTYNNLYISGTSGSSIYVTGIGKTVEEAREIAYNRISKVSIPKMFYRNDIGADFMGKQLPHLQSLGYLENIFK